MEDNRILELYQKRDETAIEQTQLKYGAYLSKIAYNILCDRQDTEESVSDTYLAAWNTIPPQTPKYFSVYLGKLTRRISIDRLRKNTAQKRTVDTLSLDEISEAVGREDVADRVELRRLGEAIGRFLADQPEETRHVFLCRYYYMDPVRDIAAYCRITESKVKVLLYRTRQSLRAYLEKEGYEV